MKKILGYLNVWKLDLNSRSYKSGLIRIGLSSFVMLITMLLRMSVTIKNLPLNLFVTLLTLIIMIASILCFFVAAAECLQVGENRRKDKEK